MIPIIWPYRIGSTSAKALAVSLEARRVYSDRNYRPRENHLIVNWGNTSPAAWYKHNGLQCLNSPIAVAQASDKLQCLDILDDAGVQIPRYTVTDPADLFEDTSKVFCRTLTRANSGRGIVIAESPEELVEAPLYTANVGKRTEYRVHVFNNQIIDFSQKKKMNDERIEEDEIEFSWAIRSHDNGWVFARDSVDLPEQVADIACRSTNALGLDFAAVDCYVDTEEVAGVFEINTAPGLEGTTLERYVEAIHGML